MDSGDWLIYGAYGFTGKLVAEAAVHRDHKPLLAGRSPERLASIAEHLNLDRVVFNLQDEIRLKKTLENVGLVLNAAGPFINTGLPIVRACLETGTSYLDISGEVMVLKQIFSLDQQAQEKEIAIIPGVGFNVLASDCLARYVAEQIDNPTHLEIATQWVTDGMSPGSAKTMIESFPIGVLGRREGKLIKINVRSLRRRQSFLDGEYTVLPVTFGDLMTAYKTTQIPNITTYTAFTEQAANFYSLTEPVLRRLYGFAFVRRLANKRVENTSSRSKDHSHGSKTSQVWAVARNKKGTESQAWLETVDSYTFTAEAAVRSVEKLFSEHQVGVLTPALAFGTDFVLEIPGTKRVDKLDNVLRGHKKFESQCIN